MLRAVAMVVGESLNDSVWTYIALFLDVFLSYMRLKKAGFMQTGFLCMSYKIIIVFSHPTLWTLHVAADGEQILFAQWRFLAVSMMQQWTQINKYGKSQIILRFILKKNHNISSSSSLISQASSSESLWVGRCVMSLHFKNYKPLMFLTLKSGTWAESQKKKKCIWSVKSHPLSLSHIKTHRRIQLVLFSSLFQHH